VTLIELVVVLAILGIMAAVVGLSSVRPALAPAPGTLSAALDSIAAIRRMAITQGISISTAVAIDGGGEGEGRSRVAYVTAFPDGSVVADESLGIDRLSGRSISSLARE
jgi:prepilin-type N-terminal cleavage/methylation domain-containing protein